MFTHYTNLLHHRLKWDSYENDAHDDKAEDWKEEWSLISNLSHPIR